MTTHARLLAPLAVAALMLTFCEPAFAQVRASEVGSMSQIIDGTTITVQYSRPKVRGRDPLFGTKVVQWGETWTPGANWATTFAVDKNVTVEGHPVAKGKYSVWMLVRRTGDWTLILDPKAKRFHMNPPDSNAAQIRIPVRAREAPLTEVLTWSMPDIRITGGTLAMNWGKLVVAMNVDVEPSLQVTMAERDAQPYLGRYDYTERDDSTGAETKKIFVIDYQNGTLKGAWVPSHPYFQHFALIRVAPDWFVPGVYDETGVLYEVLRPDMVLEFSRVNGRPTTFEMRDQDDKVIATGKRAP